ncbi:CaiB/BaiF CoA transferase family protein [Thermodesulfobacteriota bacterium]
MKKHALTGLNIIGFVTAGVGPIILRTLGSNGANVVRIESIKKLDVTRMNAPFKDNIPDVNRAYGFAHTAPNSYGMTLNMKHPRAGKITAKLVEWADVIIQNWRPGVMEKWKLGYEDLKAIKPNIIMVSSSQMGETGPHRNIAAAGPHLAGLAGFVELTGWPDRPPVSVGVIPDHIAPSYAVTSILAALEYRKKTGKGQFIDVSQYETSIHFLMPAILDYTVNKRVQRRDGYRAPNAAPHGVYRCKGDDNWCAVAVFSNSEWEAFCKVIDLPWTRDEKFGTLAGRKSHEDELNNLIENWTVEHTAEEVMQKMQQAGVAAGVVRTMGEVIESCPQARHRHYFSTINHPVIEEMILAGNSHIFSRTPYEFNRPGPCLGEHTHHVCTRFLGMSDEEYNEMHNENVFE